MSYVNLPDSMASILDDLERRLHALESTDSAYLTPSIRRIGNNLIGAGSLALTGAYQAVPNSSVNFTIPAPRALNVLVLANLVSYATGGGVVAAANLALYVNGAQYSGGLSGYELQYSYEGGGAEPGVILAADLSMSCPAWAVLSFAPGTYSAEWRAQQTAAGQTLQVSQGQIDVFLLGG